MAKKSTLQSDAKNCFLGATIIVTNNGKNKYLYSGYRIAFNGTSSWSFCNDFARNLIIFNADNNLLSTTNNVENYFLLLGEGTNDDINDFVGATEKNLVLAALKQKKIKVFEFASKW